MDIISLVLALAILSFYVAFLWNVGKSDRWFKKCIQISACIIFMACWIMDTFVLFSIPGNAPAGDQVAPMPFATSIFSNIALGFIHSVETFLFQTHIFDNGYEEFFFGRGVYDGHFTLLTFYSLIFLMAIATSLTFVIRGVVRYRTSRKRLEKRALRGQAKGANVFFGLSHAATLLASDIKNVVFIIDPQDNKDFDLSIWDKLRKLFGKENSSLIEGLSADRILTSKVPLRSVKEDFYKETGLSCIKPYLDEPTCKLFILTDDEDANLDLADILLKVNGKAQIYCRATRSSDRNIYRLSINLVDPAYLSFRYVKGTDACLPVNYVELGTDSKGRPEGWVKSAFDALVLGDGAVGREAVRFLNEYAAFCGKDFKRSKYSCELVKTQDVLDNESLCSVLDRHVKNLNYVVVAAGSDSQNLQTAIGVLDYVHRRGRDLTKRFFILLYQEKESQLCDNLLAQYNDGAGIKLAVFGRDKDIWKYDIVTDSGIIDKARVYFDAYQKASGENGDWDTRETDIADESKGYEARMNKIYGRAQDYSNCLHSKTKCILMGGPGGVILSNAAATAGLIPAVDWDKMSKLPATASHIDPTSFEGDAAYAGKVLDYLANTEHLRWMAFYENADFVYGKQKSFLMKTHKCIVPMGDLDYVIQHYDYIVVKTALLLS